MDRLVGKRRDLIINERERVSGGEDKRRKDEE
jgi:hypothetical protein